MGCLIFKLIDFEITEIECIYILTHWYSNMYVYLALKLPPVLAGLSLSQHLLWLHR